MWQKRKVYVMGAGKSGLAAADYLVRHGASVWLNDEKPRASFDEAVLCSLESRGVQLELGFEGQPVRHMVDYIIQSPGIALDKPALAEAAQAGIRIISEIELGYLANKAPIIGITGSNGKTTTTSLLGEIMQQTARPVFVGGNIGEPFIKAAEALTEDAWAVLELSSFQLEAIHSFRPYIGVILNLSPDHLDRHKTFENYCQAKLRIGEFQKPTDYLIINLDDHLLSNWDLGKIKSQKLFFSRKQRVKQGAWVDETGMIQMSWQGRDAAIVPAKDRQIPGDHNLENVLAATAAAFMAGVAPEQIAAAIRNFKGVPHRIEPFLEKDGVLYVNDSKGTNTDAAIKAMEAFERPILLIAGGRGKGASYKKMAKKVKEKVKLLVLIGEDGDKIETAVRAVGYEQVLRANSMEEAVTICGEHAVSGDIVMLSPACASYDMFKNYSQRGECFKEAVLAWVAEKGD